MSAGVIMRLENNGMQRRKIRPCVIMRLDNYAMQSTKPLHNITRLENHIMQNTDIVVS